MTIRTLLGCSLPLLALTACKTYSQVPAGEVTAAQVDQPGRWSAALAPPSALAGKLSITGWAALVPDSGGTGTLATVSVSDAPRGEVLGWSVNRGRCDADGGVYGSAGAYPPIRVDSAGRATASARVPLRLPASGNFFVSVRDPSAGGAAPIACGNLAPPTP